MEVESDYSRSVTVTMDELKKVLKELGLKNGWIVGGERIIDIVKKDYFTFQIVIHGSVEVKQEKILKS